MPYPCRVFFDPSSEQEIAGTQALKDLADALFVDVAPVTSWTEETCTPLPQCTIEDAALYSVEDMLHDIAVERCCSTSHGWEARSPTALPFDLQRLEAEIAARGHHVSMGQWPPNLTLGKWLVDSEARLRTRSGHRPFVGPEWKREITRRVGNDVARFVLCAAIRGMVGVALEARHLRAGTGLEEARRISPLFLEVLTSLIDDFTRESSRPPFRDEAARLVRKAWSEAKRRLLSPA